MFSNAFAGFLGGQSPAAPDVPVRNAVAGSEDAADGTPDASSADVPSEPVVSFDDADNDFDGPGQTFSEPDEADGASDASDGASEHTEGGDDVPFDQERQD